MYKLDNKIKLVIWDLDETFWKGTLSEGKITYIKQNHDLIIELTNRGIVNSICSKNDFNNVKNILKQYEIWDYFVFPSIDWIPKGKMVEQIIERMNLRATNVLFIDDNLMNLNEVAYMNEGINICEPKYIKDLSQLSHLKGKDDFKHTRLIQYKNLEQKVIDFESSTGSNIDFLRNSNIVVTLNNNCIDEIDRIFELVERTNQINYTKLRDTKEILINKIQDLGNESGYVSAKDKYGDYGIIGFYLINKLENKLEHFLFSCRILNMYIETWLYKKLGMPKLTIIGEISSTLDLNQEIDFIKEELIYINSECCSTFNKKRKILIMGGCDLSQMAHYLPHSDYIDTEFNYVNESNISVHKEHTSFIKQFEIYKENYEDIFAQLEIFSKNDMNLKLFNSKWDILVYSPLNDYSRGLYKHKYSNLVIPFDLFTVDWTDSSNWYNLPKHLSTLTNTFLEFFKENFTFIGPISANEFKENLIWMLEKFPNKKIIFLSGSEVKLKLEFDQMYVRHYEMNKILYEIDKKYHNFEILQVDKIVVNENMHKDNNIRHYTRDVYKKIADKLLGILAKDDIKLKDDITYRKIINIYEVLKNLMINKEKIIIYGYGSLGKLIAPFLRNNLYGIIDKNLSKNNISSVDGIDVIQLHQLLKYKDCKIVITPLLDASNIIEELKLYTENYIVL